jgi:molybdopterin-binding protein
MARLAVARLAVAVAGIAGIARRFAGMGVIVVSSHTASLPPSGVAGQMAGRMPGRMESGSAAPAPAGNLIGVVMRLSARNQINATVTGITQGEATANVVLDAGGARLVASITVEAASELGLQVGSQVVAIVKASDVIVAVAD